MPDPDGKQRFEVTYKSSRDLGKFDELAHKWGELGADPRTLSLVPPALGSVVSTPRRYARCKLVTILSVVCTGQAFPIRSMY
jgi:hypothetical protein